MPVPLPMAGAYFITNHNSLVPAVSVAVCEPSFQSISIILSTKQPYKSMANPSKAILCCCIGMGGHSEYNYCNSIWCWFCKQK